MAVVTTHVNGAQRRTSQASNNWTRVACLNAVFFCLGMSLALLGPCLHDLQLQTSASLAQTSRLFLTHAAGTLVGSMVAIYGLGGTKFTTIIPVSMFILAVSMACIPWCQNLALLLAIFSLQGLAFGLAFSKCCALCLVTSGTKTTSLYVSLSLGALTITLLCATVSAVQLSDTDSRHLQTTHVVLNSNHSLSRRRSVDSSVIVQSVLGNGTVPIENNGTVSQNDTVLSRSNIDSGIVNYQQNGTFFHNDTVPNNSSMKRTANNMQNDTVSNLADTSISMNLSVKLLTTTISTTTTKSRPHKPHHLDGLKLNGDSNVADGSKFRDEIRHNLGDIPSQSPVPSPTTLASAASTPTSPGADVIKLPNATHVTGNSSDNVVGSSASHTLQDVIKHLQALVTDNTEQSATIAAASDDAQTTVVAASPEISEMPFVSFTSHTSIAHNTSAVSLSQATSRVPLPELPTSHSSSTTVELPDGHTSVTKVSLPASMTPLPPVQKRTSSTFVSRRPSAVVGSCHSAPNLSSSVLLTVSVVCLIVTVVSAAVWSHLSLSYTPLVSKSSRMTTTLNSGPQFSILFTSCLLHALRSGIEWTYSGLVLEFASKVLGWCRTWSIMLLVVYWAGFALGRCLCHLVLSRVRLWPLVCLAGVLSSLTALVMLFASLPYTADAQILMRNVLMWISSAIFGLSMSLVFPTSEAYIPSGTGLMFAVVLGSSLGKAALPALCAILSDIYTADYIMRCLAAAAVAMATTCAVLKHLVAKNSSTFDDSVTTTQFELLDSSSSIDEMETMIGPMDTNEDEEAELLSQGCGVDKDTETALIDNSRHSSSTASYSIQSFIRNIANGAAKTD